MLTLKERQALTTGSKLVDGDGKTWTVSTTKPRRSSPRGVVRPGAVLWTKTTCGTHSDFFTNGELRRWFSLPELDR